MYRIGIDLGGTAIKGGITDKDNNLIYSETVPTVIMTSQLLAVQKIASDISGMIFRLNNHIENELGGTGCQNVGVGVPASVENNKVIDANNLGLVNADLAKEIFLRTGASVTLINDARAAALAEFNAGCGAGSTDFYMLTIGTGIGSSYIHNGKTVTGCNEAAGEAGHMVIAFGGRQCSCGRRGCFEAYASASALVKDASDIDPSVVNAKEFFQKKDNSPALSKLYEEYLDHLSEGITNIINMLQPDVLAIGGGISAQGESLLAPLRSRISSMVYSGHSARQTEIRAAILGNNAGIIGAALAPDTLSRQSLL